MATDRYKGGPTIGGYWGIAAAVVIAAPLFFFCLITSTMGCEGQTGCDPGLTEVFGPPALLGAAVFLGVRTLVNVILRHRFDA